MRSLTYSINVTLDGCVDHRVGLVDEELHRRSADLLAQADLLLFGRVTYLMMEEAWRQPGPPGMPEWTQPFARVIDAAPKVVVSGTLDSVDWNARLVRGGLEAAVRELKEAPGGRILTGGVMLPTELARLGLIDEYEFVVHPRVVGHGPSLLAGLDEPLDLELVGREEYRSGVVAMRYVPRRLSDAGTGQAD
ncbi:dihydrofolate reductase family protein [Agromyces aureus]|uniref:Deaminase n=1 Tax=Agromyces aureus TaxID=453304 RepID=A0A191WGK3_9MICO|nr:dihydrofolate reductase family protein [Agromyces aureus]ANJ27425.1 deaminase [Agromyces aureus]